MRNFVVKNDFNRASAHRDKKNDYSRNWDLNEELDDGHDVKDYDNDPKPTGDSIQE